MNKIRSKKWLLKGLFATLFMGFIVFSSFTATEKEDLKDTESTKVESIEKNESIVEAVTKSVEGCGTCTLVEDYTYIVGSGCRTCFSWTAPIIREWNGNHRFRRWTCDDPSCNWQTDVYLGTGSCDPCSP